MKEFIPWTKNIEQKLVVKAFLGPLKLFLIVWNTSYLCPD
jgi:hypothetical protein